MANITKHGKGWMARVFYLDNNGKRRSKSQSGFKTKTEAKLQAIEMEKKLINGHTLTDCNTPFPEYFWQWYLTFKEPILATKTKKSYEYTHNILKRYFKNISLSDITRTTYQSFLSEYGRNHAKETVSKINVHIKACVKNAVYDKLIERDFTTQTSIVFNKDNSRKIEYLNIKQIKLLVNYINDHLNYHFTSNYMILLAIYTGMRLGEIQGLQWQDINFNFKTIAIRRAWNELEGNFKDTKNESSKRIIHVNTDLLQCLAKLKDQIQPVTDQAQVFINQYHTVPTSNAVNKALRKLLKQLNINKQGFHFHSLRHTHVAYLLANQIDLYAISKRLGHSDIGTTSRIYAYLIDEYKIQTDSQIDKALNKISLNVNEQYGLKSVHTICTQNAHER